MTAELEKRRTELIELVETFTTEVFSIKEKKHPETLWIKDAVKDENYNVDFNSEVCFEYSNFWFRYSVFGFSIIIFILIFGIANTYVEVLINLIISVPFSVALGYFIANRVKKDKKPIIFDKTGLQIETHSYKWSDILVAEIKKIRLGKKAHYYLLIGTIHYPTYLFSYDITDYSDKKPYYGWNDEDYRNLRYTINEFIKNST